MRVKFWQFFTIWQFILLVVASCPPFHWISQYLNLPFLSVVVVLGGLYISWIHPKAYYLPRKVDSWSERLSIDIVFHILPLFYAFYKFGPMTWTTTTTIGSFSLLCFYLLLFRIPEVYRIQTSEMICIVAIATVLSMSTTT